MHRDQWHTKSKADKHSMKFWTSAVTLTLNAAIKSFHETFRSMMMYPQTKFSCKRISTSGYTDITFWLYQSSLWPCKWNSKEIIYDTPSKGGISPCQVWLQKVQPFRRYCPEKCKLNFWTYAWPWQPSNYFTRNSSLWCTFVWNSHISITWAFDVIFNLKIFILHDTRAYDDTSPF